MSGLNEIKVLANLLVINDIYNDGELAGIRAIGEHDNSANFNETLKLYFSKGKGILTLHIKFKVIAVNHMILYHHLDYLFR